MKRDGRLVVAITGRPNAGKSTLFNRLLGTRKALVHDSPGVTRDENRARIERGGVGIELVDTGGIEEQAARDRIGERVDRRTLTVLGGADVIVHLLDGQGGANPADQAVAKRLRALGKPVVFAVNKIDLASHESRLAEFAALGADDLVGVSAAHGRGLADLWDRVLAVAPERAASDASGSESESDGDAAAEGTEPAEPTGPPRIALVGRPNVGKSSLLNRLVGYERAIVDATPGTTRDALDVTVQRGDRSYVVVDTAGLRRPSRITEDLEGHAARSSLNALARAEVAVLVLDATQGVTDQDLRLADLAWRRGRGLIVAVNKIDLAPKLAAEQCGDEIARRLPQWPPLPVVRVSALEATGLRTLFRSIDVVVEGHRRRITTHRLNEVVRAAAETQPPPQVRHRPVKIRFAAQVKRGPQEIALFVSREGALPESYRRYLVHALREAFELVGVPLRLHVRTSTPGEKKAGARSQRAPRSGRKGSGAVHPAS